VAEASVLPSLLPMTSSLLPTVVLVAMLVVLIDWFWSGPAGRRVRPSWRQPAPIIARIETEVRRATRRTPSAYATRHAEAGQDLAGLLTGR
jgi:hypothetical protein